MLRLITASQAYQRDSSKLDATTETQSNDLENLYYWRANSKRMTSQMLRDVVQACGDALDFHIGGPPVPPGKHSARRSIYFRHSRDDTHRFHVSFDDASILECYRRQESIAPQQALALMNDKDVFTVSRRLAERSMTDRKNRSKFLSDSFIRVLGRGPHSEEMAACIETLERLTGTGSAEIEARTTVVLALFNHNDFITVR